MEYRDYYKVLGVGKTATQEEIKKAYRRLARKYHPDTSKEADAAQRMAEINEANTVLSDPQKRAEYDQLGDASQFQGAAGFQPPPGWGRSGTSSYSFHSGGGHFDGEQFSSFFEELFGKGRQFRQHHTPQDMRGQDQHADIELGIPESYTGATRILHLRGMELDANGHVTEKIRELHVTVPKGVYEGQLIRLGGKGQPGIGKGEPGDLLLQVHFAADPRWRAEGKNVYQQLPLAPWEAALGGAVQFNTLAGMLEINVPAGSQTGRKLRIKGKGLPAREPGDLYLVVQLVMPNPDSDAQRHAYAALAHAFPHFNPRAGAAP